MESKPDFACKDPEDSMRGEMLELYQMEALEREAATLASITDAAFDFARRQMYRLKPATSDLNPKFAEAIDLQLDRVLALLRERKETTDER